MKDLLFPLTDEKDRKKAYGELYKSNGHYFFRAEHVSRQISAIIRDVIQSV
jgi:hypothetical protein